MKYADTRWHHVEYTVSDRVLPSTHNLRLQRLRKFRDQYVRAFRVIESIIPLSPLFSLVHCSGVMYQDPVLRYELWPSNVPIQGFSITCVATLQQPGLESCRIVNHKSCLLILVELVWCAVLIVNGL